MPILYTLGYFAIGVVAWEVSARLFVPWLAYALYSFGRRDLARRILARSVRRPSLLPQMYRSGEHRLLAHLCAAAGDYREAAAQWRQALCRGIARSEEEHIRQCLIICHIESGDFGTAREELDRFRARCPEAYLETEYFVAVFQLFAHEGRYEEAEEAWERVLAAFPDSSTTQYQLALLLAGTLYDAGHLRDAASWTDRALHLACGEELPASSYSTVGACFAGVGRLAEAETYHRKALELSEGVDNPSERAAMLALLAVVQTEQGQFEAALNTCVEAAATSPDGVASASYVEAFCRLYLGQVEEARLAHARCREAAHTETPVRPLNELFAAWLEAESGDTAAARRHLAASKFEPGVGARWAALQTAMHAWILALEGHDAEARIEVDGMLCDLPSEQDLNARGAALAAAAFTCGVLGENTRCIAIWEQQLATTCSPTARTGTLLHLGEARLRLGDSVGAGRAFQECIAIGVDSQYSGRAREHLALLDAV